MQHQYWITKQTLSRKLGRKEDECIISSDAQLDAKLELFRNIQMSCSLIQGIINKYQESICYLSQEINSMGRFLKENHKEDKTRAGDVMLTIGKSLIFCAQQQLILHEPLIRFYQELETFRQRAVGDTLQNVLAMEKARTEYRAALSWMKNVSQQLDPDTTKQLEKFKRVQQQVRRGKMIFDKQSFDCLQKIDLLAAARCNMFNQSLTFYQNKLITYIEKSAGTYSTISEKFDCQHQDEVVKENKKEFIDKELQSSESDSLLMDNITTERDMFEEFTVKDYSKDSDLENLNVTNQSFVEFGEFQSANDFLKSDNQEKNDKLNIGSVPKNKNSINEISNLETCGRLKNDCYNEDENTFLPSALLKQSLESAINTSGIKNINNLMDKNYVDSLKKKDNVKSWMNLFEELDPLSNSLNEKNAKEKNSFV